MWNLGRPLRLPVLILIVGIGCSRKEPTLEPQADDTPTTVPSITKGYESPEAAYRMYSAAAAEEDFVGMAAALTPDSRVALSGQLCLMISVFGEFDPEGPAACEAFLSSHGVHDLELAPNSNTDHNAGPAAFMRALGRQVKSTNRFIPAAFEFLKKIPDANIEGFGRGTIGKITVLDEIAFATVSTATDRRTVEFRNSGTGWLVQIPDSAFALDAGGQLDAEFSDLELGDEFDFHFDEEDSLALPSPMTREEFDTAWKQSVSHHDTPAITVIEQIAERSGLKVYEQPHLEAALSKKITLEAEGLSAVQLIERAAAQVGLYPKYKLKTVAFARGPRLWPAAFTGPFIIVVDDLDVRVPWPVARMELQIFAAGMPEAMISQMLRLNSLSADDQPTAFSASTGEIRSGNEQLHESSLIGSGRRASFRTLMMTHVYTLKNLLRNVKQTEAVTGRISWPFTVETESVSFNGISDGDSATSGNVTLTLVDSLLAETSRVSVEVKGCSVDQITLIGRDSNELLLVNNFSSGVTTDDQAVLHVTIEGRPAQLEAIRTTRSDRLSYSFLLPPIEFTEFQEMPQQIAPLALEGSAPVDVAFNQIVKGDDFHKILLTIENRSNKAVHAMRIRRTYLDKNNQQLTSEAGLEHGNRVLLDTEASTDLEISTIFIPDEATGLIADVEFVEFADGTTWEPETEDSNEDNRHKDGESAEPPALPSAD